MFKILGDKLHVRVAVCDVKDDGTVTEKNDLLHTTLQEYNNVAEFVDRGAEKYDAIQAIDKHTIHCFMLV